MQNGIIIYHSAPSRRIHPQHANTPFSTFQRKSCPMSETHFLSEKEQQLVRSEAPECEQTGTWTDALLELARDKKLFHLAVPEKLGGRQLSVAELMNVFESASHIDGSFGWTITLGAGAGVFAA